MTTSDIKSKIITTADIPALLKPGMRVYIQGFTGEPTAIWEAIAAAPDACADITFTGIWIPGINLRNPLDFHPSTRVEIVFMCPQFGPGLRDGRVSYHHLHYSDAFKRFATGPKFDLAVLHTSPPDENGIVTPGIAADLAAAIRINSDKILIQSNALMPATNGPTQIPIEEIDYILEADTPLLTYDPGEPTPEIIEIANFITPMIHDGDCLQFGVGKIPPAILAALTSKKNLRIYSGMVTDPVLDLIDAGAIVDEEGAIVTGTAVGNRLLYDRSGTDKRFRFLDVERTHGIHHVSAIDNFVSINSALEVDLFGQVAADMVGSRQLSGTGGSVDYTRAANASKGGRPIIGLGATAKKGTISRIVPNISPGNAITVSRADVGIIVTEYGVADLRGLDIDARARALISIAAPDFRPQLTEHWKQMKAKL